MACVLRFGQKINRTLLYYKAFWIENQVLGQENLGFCPPRRAVAVLWLFLDGLTDGAKQKKGDLLLIVRLLKIGAILRVGQKSALDEHGGAVKAIKQENARIRSLDLAGVVLL